MKSNKKVKVTLILSTLLCSMGSLNARDIVITEQDNTSTPLGAIGRAVSKVVNGGAEVIKKSATAVTDTVGLTDSRSEVNREEDNVRYYRHHHRGYLNGYKGYHYARPHYQRYEDGWYYPNAAFRDNSEARSLRHNASYSLPSSHVRYCETHYRSYRLSDNSFQPFHGPRQQCYSRYYQG